MRLKTVSGTIVSVSGCDGRAGLFEARSVAGNWPRCLQLKDVSGAAESRSSHD